MLTKIASQDRSRFCTKESRLQEARLLRTPILRELGLLGASSIYGAPLIAFCVYCNTRSILAPGSMPSRPVPLYGLPAARW